MNGRDQLRKASIVPVTHWTIAFRIDPVGVLRPNIVMQLKLSIRFIPLGYGRVARC
jgi:hypothetical protein